MEQPGKSAFLVDYCNVYDDNQFKEWDINQGFEEIKEAVKEGYVRQIERESQDGDMVSPPANTRFTLTFRILVNNESFDIIFFVDETLHLTPNQLSDKMSEVMNSWIAFKLKDGE